MSVSETVTGQTPTFLWLTGHVRNVGDSMLRRPLAALFRETGPIQVWTGAPGSGYEKGLQIRPEESSRTFSAWAWSFTVAAFRGKPTFVFNAGEFVATKAYFFGLLILAPALFLASAKGSHIVWVGAGVRNRRRYLMWPFDVLARAADVLMWRDSKSDKLMGRGGLMPDLGFGLGPGGADDPSVSPSPPMAREFITICLRGDRRPPSEEWLGAVERLSWRLDRRIACVVQVEDDDELARQVSTRLGATLLSWGDGDHWLQEQQARAMYARSILVLSDRLHGLIMAATEGAIPLGWCEAATAKVSNHFDVIGADWVGSGDMSPISLLDAIDSSTIQDLATRTVERIRDARVRVDSVRSTLTAMELRE